MKHVLVFLIATWAAVAAAQPATTVSTDNKPVVIAPPKCTITTTDVEGVADNFGGGIDLTSLSPALTAFLNANPPRSQYDQPGCDVHFGESFHLCTCETCGARLEIIVRKCGTPSTAQNNDGFVVGVAPFGAGQRVVDGLVWAPGDPATKTLIIPLPFAKLNQVLCGNHTDWLDVYFQDDTIVDSMKLIVQHP